MNKYKYIGAQNGAVFNIKSNGKLVGPVYRCKIYDLDEDPKNPLFVKVEDIRSKFVPPVEKIVERKEVKHEQ